MPPDRSGIVDHHTPESAPRLLSTRMSFVPNHVGNLTSHFSTASSENKNRLTQSFPRCPGALCEGIAWCFRSIPFYVCAPNCLENLSAKLLALISRKWRGRSHPLSVGGQVPCQAAVAAAAAVGSSRANCRWVRNSGWTVPPSTIQIVVQPTLIRCRWPPKKIPRRTVQKRTAICFHSP